MKIIVCLDEQNGMLFLGRRQSQDSVLRAHMLAYTGGSALWMNAYSAKQFSELPDGIRVDEAFLEKAGEDDFCFVEDPSGLRGKQADRLIIYRWNRRYPSDVKFPMEAFAPRMRLHSSCEFVGSSHECITQEVYDL